MTQHSFNVSARLARMRRAARRRALRALFASMFNSFTFAASRG
jgi:hypothetical protein